jgi:hypothetical protein
MDRDYAIVNPSSLKHALCASMNGAQFSRPFVTTQVSRTSLVSGQLQQIFFPDFPTGGGHDSFDENVDSCQQIEKNILMHNRDFNLNL